MKKILLLTISILMVTAVFAKAGNPIPSYSVPVTNKAYFQENGQVLNSNSPSDEKRDMNVSNEGSSGNGNRPVVTDVLVVYIYRLDRSAVMGPFIVPVGETLTISIDGNLWGVSAQSEVQTVISVWTNDKP